MQIYLFISVFLLFTGSVVCAQTDYRRIDRHVRRAPEKLSENIDSLTAYLIRPATTEAEKLRALYRWTTENIGYDYRAYRGETRRINKRIKDILRRKVAVCFGYARLLKAMCDRAEIPCVVVSGYSKGTLTAKPGLEEPDHAWNAVRLKGQWRLLDATWGGSVTQNTNEFVKDADVEAYFLTPPQTFILNHLPADPRWQLLPCPIRPEEFQLSAERIRNALAQRDSCYDYPNRIEQWLQLPAPKRRIATARSAYDFHATEANRASLGHAYMDLATEVFDSAEYYQQQQRHHDAIRVQEEVITACEKAAGLLEERYNWQMELHCNALINQGVAKYQLANQLEGAEQLRLLEAARTHLLRAREVLTTIEENTFYKQYAQRNQTAYLETVEQMISRLKDE